MAKSGRRRSSGMRNASNGSNKSIFRNPEDQIYEEPELIMDPAGNASTQGSLPLRSRDRNSILRGSRPLPEKPGVTFAPQQPRHNRVEIHKNPPSRSRNAAYTSSVSHARHQSIDEAEEEPRRSVDGIEIRSDDIRAATGFKLKDRSAKLPTPSAVSDQLGRPIVSFDPSWRPSGDSPRNSHDTARPVIKFTESPRTSKDMQRPLPRPLPSTSEAVNTAPAVPTINLPGDDDVPSIQVDDCSGPSISVTAPEIAVTAPTAPTYSIFPPAEPKSAPKLQQDRCLYMPLQPLFHPECFACHHCQANLECIAFFPEPDAKRAERLEAEGIAEGSEEADVRFYCSLDYAEMFAPRCKSCKTPIEGEVIVAAGAEWHVGHFFCAECGDPFDSNTPFVEKDGYAYCVRCHTKRTSARCRECKQQILEEVTVEALGGKWHESCFKCFECEGGFGEDGRFFIRDVSVEPTDKEKRKGIMAKMEEKAVCSGCEERRLKA
ncbi:LIM domain-containing protein C4F6.12 [Cyphellophora attinorum]|uniref:LIM domain-containing protein C4F6.12 n=1 Tax=Cyphellophora attinorum TaxID=1664694 RepID=A0A0N1HQR1_9EURO|nr:LIM domain-containing protein C4F6.12 [Phialophora attinorum]KPI37916.1 LIM domain-containing protein C4F6.12 [Phialophora attinorum]